MARAGHLNEDVESEVFALREFDKCKKALYETNNINSHRKPCNVIREIKTNARLRCRK